jgi:hypothetical protein
MPRCGKRAELRGCATGRSLADRAATRAAPTIHGPLKHRTGINGRRFRAINFRVVVGKRSVKGQPLWLPWPHEIPHGINQQTIWGQPNGLSLNSRAIQGCAIGPSLANRTATRAAPTIPDSAKHRAGVNVRPISNDQLPSRCQQTIKYRGNPCGYPGPMKCRVGLANGQLEASPTGFHWSAGRFRAVPSGLPWPTGRPQGPPLR